MLLLRLLLLSLLPGPFLAAKSDFAKRFNTYHKKALSTTPIKIDDSSYHELTNPPRDYSVVILLTALEARFGCHVCREFQPEWDVLAKSWSRGDRQGKSRLIYATLDFVDGKNTFQKVSGGSEPMSLECVRVKRLVVDATNCTHSTFLPSNQWPRC